MQHLTTYKFPFHWYLTKKKSLALWAIYICLSHIYILSVAVWVGAQLLRLCHVGISEFLDIPFLNSCNISKKLTDFDSVKSTTWIYHKKNLKLIIRPATKVKRRNICIMNELFPLHYLHGKNNWAIVCRGV